ncbi:uncharacterized protein [Prorops nasuta]|uniref:uncharacterized protein n=1 Tax=Prorops nasuta TaxID=863751 RepID=UPI0034CEDFDB
MIGDYATRMVFPFLDFLVVFYGKTYGLSRREGSIADRNGISRGCTRNLTRRKTTSTRCLTILGSGGYNVPEWYLVAAGGTTTSRWRIRWGDQHVPSEDYVLWYHGLIE